MAYNNIHGMAETYLAGEDLSNEIYTFVKRGSGDAVVQANAGEAAVGVLFNDPANGRAATVVRGGEPQVYAGAAVAVGAEVTSDAEGRAVTATSTDIILGYARTAAGAANELITVEFLREGQVAKA